MKTKLLIALITVSAMVISGCTAPAPEAVVDAAQPESVNAPVVEAEPEITYTMPDNDMGLINITIEGLQERINNGESFYLYIQGDENVPYDYESIEQGFANLEKDYEVPCDFCFINESILTDDEYPALGLALGMEQQSVIASFEDGGKKALTYSGLYAFENGTLKCTRYDFVPSEQNVDIPSHVVNFVFESDLFVNTHGLEIVTCEQVMDKITSGEKFMLYVSRDTCPFCLAFTPSLTRILADRPANVPVYYFYTQSFKTAINHNNEGAQETWDSVKASIGFMYTPSLLVFDGGEQILAFEGGIGSDYFEMSDENKEFEREKVYWELDEWFTDNNLTDTAR